jgi:transcriptional regulator with XRE-family HTH domain
MVFDDKDFGVALGRSLQELRQKRGYTLDQIVNEARLSVSRSSLSAIENGNQDISARDLYALSTVLGFDLNGMMNEVREALLSEQYSTINLQR